MLQALRISAAALATALLAACGGTDISSSDGNGGTISAFCQPLIGEGAEATATVDPGCTDCSIENEQAVADDSAYSFAKALIGDSLPEQGIVLRATAPSGTTYEAGSRAGAFLSEFITNSSGLNVNGSRYKLTTYLAGIPIENRDSGGGVSVQGPNQTSFAPGSQELPHKYVWFETLLPFDSVELTIYRTALATQAPAEYRVFELCWDGGVN